MSRLIKTVPWGTGVLAQPAALQTMFYGLGPEDHGPVPLWSVWDQRTMAARGSAPERVHVLPSVAAER